MQRDGTQDPAPLKHNTDTTYSRVKQKVRKKTQEKYFLINTGDGHNVAEKKNTSLKLAKVFFFSFLSNGIYMYMYVYW